MQLIRDACTRGVAAVLVTHDAQLASWADRVLLVRDGQVTDAGAQAGPRARLAMEPGR
jgi:putative ABC transport system ATP-binding protein